MIQGESLLVWNMAMCACALPLGGKWAGLPAPGKRELGLSAVMNGVLSLMGPAAVLGLPGGVAMCFHKQGFGACMRGGLMTLMASLLSGGAMTALMAAGWSAEGAAVGALAASAAAYLFATLLPQALCDVRQVELRANGNAILLPAMVDSGNLLRDPITGLGVLVIPWKAAQTLFECDLGNWEALPPGFRLMHVRTAAGTAMLPLFRPDVCRIYVNGLPCDTEALVAVAGREYGGAQALVPLSALPTEGGRI